MLPSQYKAIYIDTEGTFRPERIESIAKARGWDPVKILSNIQVTKPLDSARQESSMKTACSMSDPKVKLLVVDSMTSHYRVDYSGRSKLPEKQQRLNKYMHMLLKTAQTHRVAVVVTNQMQSNPDSSIFEKSMPVGGHVMLYASTHVVHLRRLKLDNYQAELGISHCYPRKIIGFMIDQRGVVDG